MHQHMTHQIERELEEVAKEISHRYGASVVIVMGDTTESDVPRVMTAFADQTDMRLRDVLGLLQTSIQYEGIRHFAL